MFREICRHARRVRLTKRQRARTGFDQQAVCVAVVAAFEFDNLIAASKTTRRRIALIVASVPEFTMRTMSMVGTGW